jgi:methylphosphotriester-DNA--protein-cysteine methyltransferase
MLQHKDKDINGWFLFKKIRSGEVILGGNAKLKVYGKLNCKSGKRMKVENRVFFGSKKEALQNGYRPCGHCMKKEYGQWKNKTAQ